MWKKWTLTPICVALNECDRSVYDNENLLSRRQWKRVLICIFMSCWLRSSQTFYRKELFHFLNVIESEFCPALRGKKYHTKLILLCATTSVSHRVVACGDNAITLPFKHVLRSFSVAICLPLTLIIVFPSLATRSNTFYFELINLCLIFINFFHLPFHFQFSNVKLYMYAIDSFSMMKIFKIIALSMMCD